MMSNEVLMKHHIIVMLGDVTQHILPSNSAEEGLINYCVFKTLYSCTLSTCTQFIPCGSQSAQTLDYIVCITLHYITIVFYNLHCIHAFTGIYI